MNLDDVQAAAWRAVADVPANPKTAIYKRWQALKAQGSAVGVPTAAETTLEDGTVAQPFSSGVVLHWTGGDTVEVV